MYLSISFFILSEKFGWDSCSNLSNCGKDLTVLHVSDELSWDLLEHFFGQFTVFVGRQEFDELNSITSGYFATARSEHATIAIKGLHLLEGFISYTNNNNTAGKLGCLNNQVNSLRHIEDLTVGKEKHNTVAVLSHTSSGDVQELTDDRGEVGGTGKTHIHELVSVELSNALSALNFRVRFIKVQSEAVRGGVSECTTVWHTTETVDRE